MKNTIKALTRAKDYCKSQHGLARAINRHLNHKSVKPVRQQHVYNWLKGARLPSQYCIPIERATNGEVKAIHLRPDTFLLGYEVTK
jgi:DNA-binding transcriptional regulator YdaS (Cro superfamily)